jgi:hypothetical protein
VLETTSSTTAVVSAVSSACSLGAVQLTRLVAAKATSARDTNWIFFIGLVFLIVYRYQTRNPAISLK